MAVDSEAFMNGCNPTFFPRFPPPGSTEWIGFINGQLLLGNSKQAQKFLEISELASNSSLLWKVWTHTATILPVAEQTRYLSTLYQCLRFVEVDRTSPEVAQLAPCFQWGQSANALFVRVKFTPKLDVPTSFRSTETLKVSIREDQFSVSAIEFRWSKFIHWRLNLHFFYHILPKLSDWEVASQGTVELEFTKGVKIVWRNIHHEATKILPNQYLWTEILQKYSDELESDLDLAIFQKAEARIEEEETKKNDEKLRRQQDKQNAVLVDQILAERVGRIKAATRAAFSNAPRGMEEDLFEWGDFYLFANE